MRVPSANLSLNEVDGGCVVVSGGSVVTESDPASLLPWNVGDFCC